MRLRKFLGAVAGAAVLGSFVSPAGSVVRAQQQQQPAGRAASGEGTPVQRVAVMRSRLEAQRRTLNSAIAALNVGGEKKEQKITDDAAGRLRGVEREVGQLLTELNELSGRVDRAEKFDPADLDRLEAAVRDLNERGDKTLQETAGERRALAANAPANKKDKKKKGGGGFLGLGSLFGGDDDEDKYAELMSGPAVGRDRELFEEAAKLTRKSNYEGSRLLFSTVITTYPDSPYLPHAKLAIADTFYLEGTTSALIQAGNAYQEWLTFFPTDPLADEVLLKVAEVEMRQMGLPDRDVTHARKAEQRLKALLQQFPQSSLRPEVEIRLRETQENLGMNSFSIGNFYYDRYLRGVAPNPKGAQSRYREVVEKYPHFSRMDKALYLLGVTYVQEEEPDEAVKYFQRILREHPESEFAEKAREQLDAIGAEKPEADPTKSNKVPPPDRGMMRRFLDQLIGTTPKTIDKDGVLIRKDSKEPALIDVIIDNKGALPVTTPTAPNSSRRIPPARNVVPQQPRPQQQPPAPRPAPVQGDTEKPKAQTPPPANATQPQTVDGVRPQTAQPAATPTPPPGR